MTHADASVNAPKVFVSYAQSDRRLAERFVKDLASMGIQTFFAPDGIDPGVNFVAELSEQLAASDYFVLLISKASVKRRWVTEEWTTALAREVNELRAFLFLLRLDETPPPMILSTRNYLDAFEDWHGAVQMLVTVWKRDWRTRRQEIHVLPAPGLASSPPEEGTMEIFVFNDSLRVEHFLRLSPNLTGRQAYARVRAALDLKDSVAVLGGKVGLRFEYTLHHKGVPLCEEIPLAATGVKNGDSLELGVTVEQFAPSRTAPAVHYRDVAEESGMVLQPQQLRRLLRDAFAHLMP